MTTLLLDPSFQRFRPKFTVKRWLYRGWTPVYLWSEFNKSEDIWPNTASEDLVFARSPRSPLFLCLEKLLCLFSSLIPVAVHLVAWFVLDPSSLEKLYQEFHLREMVESDLDNSYVST